MKSESGFSLAAIASQPFWCQLCQKITVDSRTITWCQRGQQKGCQHSCLTPQHSSLPRIDIHVQFISTKSTHLMFFEFIIILAYTLSILSSSTSVKSWSLSLPNQSSTWHMGQRNIQRAPEDWYFILGWYFVLESQGGHQDMIVVFSSRNPEQWQRQRISVDMRKEMTQLHLFSAIYTPCYSSNL